MPCIALFPRPTQQAKGINRLKIEHASDLRLVCNGIVWLLDSLRRTVHSLVNRRAVNTLFRILSISDQMSCKGHTESFDLLQKVWVGELCTNPIELTSLYSSLLFVFKEQGIDCLKLSREEDAPKWHKWLILCFNQVIISNWVFMQKILRKRKNENAHHSSGEGGGSDLDWMHWN